MSGPFPPPGYPRQPDQGGWPGSQPPGQGPSGQYGPPGYNTGDFPAQPNYGGLNNGPDYGGFSGPGGGWGEDPNRPPKQKHLARTVLGIVSVVVIVAGVATGIVLLTNRHTSPQASGGGGGGVSTAPSAPGSGSTSSPAGSGGGSGESSANGGDSVLAGQTGERLNQGDCVGAQVGVSGQYDLGAKTACGQSASDLLLARTASAESGCTAHEYLLVQGPGTFYCFTLDVKQGDCLDGDYLKTSCTGGEYAVLATEPGPGSASSCKDQAAATHWVPVGPDPVSVGCIGPNSH